MVASTWNDRELPILEAVAEGEEGEAPVTNGDLADVTGIEIDSVDRSVHALVRARYLTGHEVPSGGGRIPGYFDLTLLERGRRAVGQWPPDASEAFLVGLNRLIAAETDPDERTRLARLRDAAADVGKQVLAGAIVAAGQAQL